MMDERQRPPRRLQTSTERDLEGVAQRRARESTPIVSVPDEITGQYEGEELAAARARRPTAERVARLEVKHDALAGVVSDTREEVAKMSGKLDVLPDLVRAVQQSGERSAAREHVTFTAQVDVAKEREIDVIRARAGLRELLYRLLGFLGGGGLIELLHRLGIL